MECIVKYHILVFLGKKHKCYLSFLQSFLNDNIPFKYLNVIKRPKRFSVGIYSSKRHELTNK